MGIISVENKIPVLRRDAVSQEQELKKAKGTILRTYYLWTRKRKKNNKKKFPDRYGGKNLWKTNNIKGTESFKAEALAYCVRCYRQVTWRTEKGPKYSVTRR